MKVCSLHNLSCPHGTAVALGTFDGLHLGHQGVIQTACNQPGRMPTVFSVVSPRTEDWLITPDQTEAVLTQMGVELYVPTPLEEISHLSPTDFFENVLLQKLNARHLVCGFNFRFGHKAAGDIDCLQQLCDKHGVGLTVMDAITYQNQPISSSRIRTALKEGDLHLANQMLGRAYGFSAPILHGQHLGRKLGFPTINQAVPANLTMPKNGVYAVTAMVDGNAYGGVCNVGRHPTVGNLSTPLAETYLLDFHGDIYGKVVSITFIEFLRSEQTFDSLTDLQKAIGEDVNRARQIL